MISTPSLKPQLTRLAEKLEGEFNSGETLRRLYATDASAYRELPTAVAFPKTEDDIRTLIEFANEHRVALIPRTAGTSLAGQVVGHGIVVDVSRHWNRILEINPEQRTVRVQPGVVRDELNLALKPHGLMFGPETSTSNRAMIGGMVGNNSCGSNSLIYGNTRDHLLDVKGFLSDGSPVHFSALDSDAFQEKCAQTDTLEGRIYNHLHEMLQDRENQQEIQARFPKPSIKRRNTGYAVDQMLMAQPFQPEGPAWNLCRLVAGSEGTLCFLTEITLSLDPLPPEHSALVCAHFSSVLESLEGNRVALQYQPRASELIDRVILECTRKNIEQRKNRFFIEGDPGAILVIELAADSAESLEEKVQKLIRDLKDQQLGYHFPVLRGEDMPKVWNLRKAGLGLLSNVPGDAKPVAVVEDTAVDTDDLPRYISEYDQILESMGLDSVYYAHAGSGELHIRPVLNLKTTQGQKQFREVAEQVARLVKKYRGSLSGEHGDGRLRGEFIAFMMGDTITDLFQSIKKTWDPHALFNPGKIVHTPAMDTHLRYRADQEEPEFTTHFDYSETGGFLRAAEMCNGSGDCRKSHLIGGTMCPSFQATRHEMDTTRARANILREMITHASGKNPFASEEIHEVMDLCLSCKGCKSECPSNVDISKLKAEFLQGYYDAHGIPRRAQFFADFVKHQKRASALAPLANLLARAPGFSTLAKKALGIHPRRSLPPVASTPLRKWIARQAPPPPAPPTQKRRVVLFLDEFTNYLDTEAGKKTYLLLQALGYEIVCPEHSESGRAALSKGLLRQAKVPIQKNVELLSEWVSEDSPLVGIEPSALLTFRDEAPALVESSWKARAEALANHSFLIDEFLAAEFQDGHIDPRLFTTERRNILLHGHCHQKAIASVEASKILLSIPVHYTVETIPSGCCGMAGSFGYEAEHYDLSMKIGSLVLFPKITASPELTTIAAPGTSCRHQIHDGTGRSASHPVEILYQALLKQP